ncbi:stress-response A/B barrel domain-containing protein UP3-like protein [Tanacetum coccineum]
MKVSTKVLCAPVRIRLLPSLSFDPLSRHLTCCINHRNLIRLSAGQDDQIIEHVVLYKVKPDADSSKVAAMVNGLNSLTSLNLTLHVSAGKLLRSRSSSFTHMLHTRYRSMDDLSKYRLHPEHLRLRMETVKPIVDDVMAVDWISTCGNGSVSPKPGSAMRVALLKLKDSLNENERGEVLELVGGIRDQFEMIQQYSSGENFSHDRAKGYTIASIAVLPGLDDLEAMDSLIDHVYKPKVKDLIETELVVHYVCPPSM